MSRHIKIYSLKNGYDTFRTPLEEVDTLINTPSIGEGMVLWSTKLGRGIRTNAVKKITQSSYARQFLVSTGTADYVIEYLDGDEDGRRLPKGKANT